MTFVRFDACARHELRDQRVLIRQDLNVPMRAARGGSAPREVITSAQRITAALPTIRQAAAAGGRVQLMSHLGRPQAGAVVAEYSLAPVADYLTQVLAQPVPLVTDYLTVAPKLEAGQVVLLENVRLNAGELENDPTLSQQYARLCDWFVMDAFGSAHREQASTYGVAQYAARTCAGPLLCAELTAIERARTHCARPLIAVAGGAKISSKMKLLAALLERVDILIPGGGIANTFMAAAGYAIGQSLYQAEQVGEAERILTMAAARDVLIPLPRDVVVATALTAGIPTATVVAEQVQPQHIIGDIGPETARWYAELLAAAGTIVWNGPVGLFELSEFAAGTRCVGEAIANAAAFSIAGGGDTLAAIEQFKLTADISYISTGGGAFLQCLQDEPLPAVAALCARRDRA